MRSLALTCLVVFVGALPAAADTILVPKHHANIQAAIDAATDGDVIVVSKGTYPGILTIDGKLNLTLKAKKKHKVVVDGQQADDAITVENSTGIVVQDLTVQWGDWYGIKVESSSDVEISKCTVKWSGGDGIHVVDSTDVRVLNNKVFECAWGGEAVELDGTTFSLVEGNTLSGDGAGVLLDGSDDNTVRNNKIRWCQNGVEVAGNRNTVEKNDIEIIVDTGISIEEFATDNDLLDNTIDACGDRGIAVDEAGNTIDGNDVTNTGDDGILIDADSCIVTDNTVKKPLDDGFRIEGEMITVTGNKALEAGNDGFTIVGANNTLTGNTSSKCRSNGFQVEEIGNTFMNNKATKNGFFDLYDNTTPGANTYIDNTFKKERLP